MLLVLSMSTVAWAETSSNRQELTKLPMDAQSVVSTWLNQDCGVAELRGLQDRLRQIGLILEPVFWEAYRLGPTELERRAILEQARQGYQDRQIHLREFGERLFSKDEVAELLGITQDQYVQRQVGDYVNRYKTAALAGLGEVATQTSELQPIAEDEKDPAQVAAMEAIRFIRQRIDR